VISNFEIHEKGWGYEKWIYNGEYCGKFLVFDEGKKCSWHYHEIKDEFFYVLDGEFFVLTSWHNDVTSADSQTLKKGLGMHIPSKLRHQLVCVRAGTILEISTHHDEFDTFRVVRGD
jgi:mannose-6-phosphate isomerase-like protein (cupin superfamily)